MDDVAARTAVAARGSGRPRVLYVAWGFPPHRNSGTYRPLAAVNTLVARGAHVTVLTADTETFEVAIGADPSLCELVDPRVVVHRVAMNHDLRDPIVNRWPPARAGRTRQWTRARAAERTKEFPEPTYVPWVRPALATALALHRADPFELTIATGNPYVDFVIAATLHVDEGVPYVLDDRDSWLLDVFTGTERPDVDAVRPWFDHALAGCRAMWFVNPVIADWHRRRFPEAAEKFDVVENGWDPYSLDLDRLAARPSRAGERPCLTYVGTVTPTFPLAQLAEAWRRAREIDDVARHGRLRIVGQIGYWGTSATEEDRLEREYREDGIDFVGRVPTRGITDVYADADALLFAKEGGAMVTSGKVYEYAATGLPVVAALEAVHDAWRVLEGHGRLFPADPADVPALAAAMVGALHEGRREDAEDRRRATAAAYASRRRDAAFARAFDRWGIAT